MSDLTINPAGIPDYKMSGKIVPYYLVSFDSGQKFVATKWEMTYPSMAKFVGFYYNHELTDLYLRYDEIIRTTDPANFVEMFIPLDKISSIRSLVYRHKTGERK